MNIIANRLKLMKKFADELVSPLLPNQGGRVDVGDEFLIDNKTQYGPNAKNVNNDVGQKSIGYYQTNSKGELSPDLEVTKIYNKNNPFIDARLDRLYKEIKKSGGDPAEEIAAILIQKKKYRQMFPYLQNARNLIQRFDQVDKQAFVNKFIALLLENEHFIKNVKEFIFRYWPEYNKEYMKAQSESEKQNVYIDKANLKANKIMDNKWITDIEDNMLKNSYPLLYFLIHECEDNIIKNTIKIFTTQDEQDFAKQIEQQYKVSWNTIKTQNPDAFKILNAILNEKKKTTSDMITQLSKKISTDHEKFWNIAKKDIFNWIKEYLRSKLQDKSDSFATASDEFKRGLELGAIKERAIITLADDNAACKTIKAYIEGIYNKFSSKEIKDQLKTAKNTEILDKISTVLKEFTPNSKLPILRSTDKFTRAHIDDDMLLSYIQQQLNAKGITVESCTQYMIDQGFPNKAEANGKNLFKRLSMHIRTQVFPTVKKICYVYNTYIKNYDADYKKTQDIIDESKKAIPIIKKAIEAYNDVVQNQNTTGYEYNTDKYNPIFQDAIDLNINANITKDKDKYDIQKPKIKFNSNTTISDFINDDTLYDYLHELKKCYQKKLQKANLAQEQSILDSLNIKVVNNTSQEDNMNTSAFTDSDTTYKSYKPKDEQSAYDEQDRTQSEGNDSSKFFNFDDINQSYDDEYEDLDNMYGKDNKNVNLW